MKYDYEFCKKVYDLFVSHEEYIGIASVGRSLGLSKCQCKKLREKMERFYDGKELEKIYRHRNAKNAISKRIPKPMSEESKKKSSLSNKMAWKKDCGERREQSRINMITYCGPNAQTVESKMKRVESRKNNGKPWHSEETKLKISIPQKGRKFNSEHITKLRVSAMKRLEERYGFQVIPNFNIMACKFLESLNAKYKLNIQHAMNGGEFYIKELGYWVDGYDKKLNLVLEYDEIGHEYKKERDIIRENEIKKLLKCDIFRIHEKTFIKDTKQLLLYIRNKING